MSTIQSYMCDHCGKQCTREFGFSLFGEWARKGATYCPDDVHGCSREHTILAVVKILGFTVGRPAELLLGLEKDLAHYKASFLAKSERCDSAEKALNESAFEHGKAIARIAELEDELASLTGPKKPTKPAEAINGCEAYLEARMDYRRVAGGTAAEMEAFWRANRSSFHRDERMVMANGDIVRDMEFE